jgi:hypothetical protein
MKGAVILILVLLTGAIFLAGTCNFARSEPLNTPVPLISRHNPGECQCGDVDCSGKLNAGDAFSLIHYLYGGGPVPASGLDMANWDDWQDLTIRDAEWCICYVFMDCVPLCPPSNPPFGVPVDAACHLNYTDRIPAGVSDATILLTLNTPAPPGSIFGYAFPVRIRVDNQIPAIDSVTYFTNGITSPMAADYSIDSDSGCLVLGAVYYNGMGSVKPVAKIYARVPVALNDRQITLDWTRSRPLQAPAPDSTIFPVLDQIYSGIEPVLTPSCCITAGDANDDRAVNIGDAVFLINHIFKSSAPPPCATQGDANYDGAINVGDVIYLINYVFRSGPTPHCAS